MKDKILIIEDEAYIQELLQYNLEKSGYEIHIEGEGNGGMTEALTGAYDLILLDLMLPGVNGIEICKALRKNHETLHTPIIMLTAKAEELDKVLGLEMGADDYVTKPFSIRELTARIKALLRRSAVAISGKSEKEEKLPFLIIRNISMDLDKFVAYKDNIKLTFTLKEFELLKVLMENKGKVLTRDFLLENVWGYDYAGETRTVDVHVRHLRNKIGDDEAESPLIETIRGVGYRMTEN